MHSHARLEADHPPNEFSKFDLLFLRRREAGETGIRLHEAAERFRAGGDHVQAAPRVIAPIDRWRIAPEQSLEATGDRFDRRERVVHFMAEHSHESLPGFAFLFPQGAAEIGQNEQFMGEATLAEVALAHTPAA